MPVEIAKDFAVPDGAELLDELHGTLTRYVVFPSPEAADATTLWTAATHAQPSWQHATRLVIKSPLRRCGKSRLEDVIAETCHAPLLTANISVAALVRSIDALDPPTILLDETDAVFAKRRGERSEKAEDLRGILNAGHSRNRPYIRWDAASRSREACPTFAMAAMAGIGDLPDTIEDRAVVIELRRRAPGERVARFRRRHALPPLHDLRDRLQMWAREHGDRLAEVEPTMPDSIEDRAQDTWEPLVAIADLAGGTWPGRARRACQALTGQGGDPDDGAISERLLDDLLDVFDKQPNDLLGEQPRMTTDDILDGLHAIGEAPWSEWGRDAKPLSARGLARLLRPYGIKPKVIRVGEKTPRGYDRADFEDAWARYTYPMRNKRNSATDTPESAGQATVAEAEPPSATRAQQPLPQVDTDESADRCAVAAVADTPPGPDHETVADDALADPERLVRDRLGGTDLADEGGQ